MEFLSRLLGGASRRAGARDGRRVAAFDDASFETSVEQAVAEMRAQLNDVVRASADAMTAHNRVAVECRHLRGEAAQWGDRAREALDSGDETFARKALAKQQECERRLESLEPSRESAQQASEMLSGQLADLRRRIEDAQRNASTLLARRNAAAAQRRVAEALSGIGDRDCAFATLGALEETVAREEAEARAYRELSADLADPLEQLRALESPDEE